MNEQMKPITILGIVGSLRKNSYNHGALRAAKELAPDGVKIEIVELHGIPLFNEDMEDAVPQSVVDFKNKIQTADAILFATPEYNYSVPGVLKNAIDWASRPYGQSSWTGKPAAIMGATVGIMGTSRAQYHLRQILGSQNMLTLNQPEVMIGQAGERFDNDGNLTDARTREHIRKLVVALAEWTRRLQIQPPA